MRELDQLLAAHRERRHEAQLAALAVLDTPPEEDGPSAWREDRRTGRGRRRGN